MIANAKRARLDADVPIGEAPKNPTNVFEFFDTRPSSSPIEFVSTQVVPWVDYVLKMKIARIIFFFIHKRTAKESDLSRPDSLSLCDASRANSPREVL